MTTGNERRPLVRVRGLYYPTDTTPEQVFQAIGKLRKDAADEIDRLIRFLDETGRDCDEDTATDDEPIDDDELEGSLGWTLSLNQGSPSRDFHAVSWDPDVEDEHDGREPDVDDEEDDPGENNGDAEPSLGWTTNGSLEAASAHFVIDGEEGSLTVAELDAFRAERRPQGQTTDGSCNTCVTSSHPAVHRDGQFVMVTRRPDASICNVRPLSPEEQAKLFGHKLPQRGCATR